MLKHIFIFVIALVGLIYAVNLQETHTNSVITIETNEDVITNSSMDTVNTIFSGYIVVTDNLYESRYDYHVYEHASRIDCTDYG